MRHRMWNVETEISKLSTKRLNEKTGKRRKTKASKKRSPFSSVFVKLG